MLTSLSPVASPAGIRATKASGTTLSPAATRQWGPMRRFERWPPATGRCATQPSAVGSAPSHWRRFTGGRLAHHGSPEGMLLGANRVQRKGLLVRGSFGNVRNTRKLFDWCFPVPSSEARTPSDERISPTRNGRYKPWWSAATRSWCAALAAARQRANSWVWRLTAASRSGSDATDIHEIEGEGEQIARMPGARCSSLTWGNYRRTAGWGHRWPPAAGATSRVARSTDYFVSPLGADTLTGAPCRVPW